MEADYKLYRFRYNGDELEIAHVARDGNIVDTYYTICNDFLADTSCVIKKNSNAIKEYSINLQIINHKGHDIIIKGVDPHLSNFLDNLKKDLDTDIDGDPVFYLKKQSSQLI